MALPPNDEPPAQPEAPDPEPAYRSFTLPPVKPYRPASHELCVHLAPVVTAMRAAGVRVDLHAGRLFAFCRIDEPALREAFALPTARYLESYDTRYTHASLTCVECGFSLGAMHPMDGGGVAFPAPSPPPPPSY